MVHAQSPRGAGSRRWRLAHGADSLDIDEEEIPVAQSVGVIPRRDMKDCRGLWPPSIVMIILRKWVPGQIGAEDEKALHRQQSAWLSSRDR
jgi:hypothetical protein